MATTQPMSDLRILLVDDQPAVIHALEVLFDLHDIATVTASGPGEALAVARRETLGAVIQDMNFTPSETDGEEGAALFRALREVQPGLPVVLMTAWGSIEAAVELVQEGAVDYIEKPWKDERVVASVQNLLRLRALEIENRRLATQVAVSRQDLAARHDLRGVVYASQAMHQVLSLAVQVAGSDAPILITGASGTGKERIAEVVQANSKRRDRAFVRVNVGAIPDDLMAAELFGAEPGSYTGQRGRRVGCFEAADGGTLFLDEIDGLSLAGQVQLLRVLQSGEIQRLGAAGGKRVDVRVVAASNAALAEAIADGRFREDLYFRLNVVELAVPPLAGRTDDILPLATHFLHAFASTSDAPTPALTAAAERALVAYDWPGNVRELENRIRRATLIAAGPEIDADAIGFAPASCGSAVPALELDDDEQRERTDLLAALDAAGGVVAHAADRLGLSRQALYRRMSRLGVELERRPRDA